MKKILSLILAMLMLACLCACGEETATPAATTAQSSEQAQNQTAADPNAGKVPVWVVSELSTSDVEDVLSWNLDYDSIYNLRELVFEYEDDGAKGKESVQFCFDKNGRITLELQNSSYEEDGVKEAEFCVRECVLYDEYGNELVEDGDYVYDEAGRIVSAEFAGGMEYAYEYDEKGQQIKETVWDYKDTDALHPEKEIVQETTYTYNADGKRIKDVTTYTYADSSETQETTYSYDEKGNLIKRVSPYGETTYTYNDQGQETSCTVKSDYDNYTHTKTYDENGCLVKIDSFAKWELKYKQVYVDASRVEAIENQQAYLLDWCDSFR